MRLARRCQLSFRGKRLLRLSARQFWEATPRKTQYQRVTPVMATLRSPGSELASASRTMRRCIPNCYASPGSIFPPNSKKKKSALQNSKKPEGRTRNWSRRKPGLASVSFEALTPVTDWPFFSPIVRCEPLTPVTKTGSNDYRLKLNTLDTAPVPGDPVSGRVGVLERARRRGRTVLHSPASPSCGAGRWRSFLLSSSKTPGRCDLPRRVATQCTRSSNSRVARAAIAGTPRTPQGAGARVLPGVGRRGSVFVLGLSAQE